MKMLMASIYDVKAGVFSQPMFFQAAPQAIRSFGDAVKEDGNLKKHPEDYSLVKLGEFEDTTGIIVVEGPVVLARGEDFVSAQMSLVKEG